MLRWTSKRLAYQNINRMFEMFSMKLRRSTQFSKYINYQRMFQKFLHVEFVELELVARVRAEYDSIFDTLMEFLTDELRKIHTEIEKDTSTMLRSWEGARVSGLQVRNIMESGNTPKERILPSFDDVRKKWGAIVS
jgi:hypothetical protein